jgi:hypothetical protein
LGANQIMSWVYRENTDKLIRQSHITIREHADKLIRQSLKYHLRQVCLFPS